MKVKVNTIKEQKQAPLRVRKMMNFYKLKTDDTELAHVHDSERVELERQPTLTWQELWSDGDE